VTDVFLGVIAVAVLTMAVIQVGAVVMAARAARRVSDVVARIEADVQPIVANLHKMSADAAKAAGIATAQVERAEQLLNDLTVRINDTADALHSTLVVPAREAFSIVQGLLGALGAFRHVAAPPRRTVPADEEDPLFIG
jgi:hypothetical protein